MKTRIPSINSEEFENKSKKEKRLIKRNHKTLFNLQIICNICLLLQNINQTRQKNKEKMLIDQINLSKKESSYCFK